MGETITIKTEDGSFSAYLARPSRDKAPAVVVIQEIFGVNAVMRDITDKSEAEWKKAFELYSAFDPDTGVKDIEAVIAAMRADPACTGKVGAVGFCLGGLLAFLAATRTDSDASASYYGVGIEKYLAADEHERLVRPLLLHVAEEDRFVPKEAQAVILQALQNHPHVELHTYPGRDHAFARMGGEHYNEADAKLAGGRTLAFFEKHLK